MHFNLPVPALSVARPGDWERHLPFEFGIRTAFPWMVASEGVSESLCFLTEKTQGGRLLRATPFGCFLQALRGESMNNLEICCRRA